MAIFIDGFDQFRGDMRPEASMRQSAYLISGSVAIVTGRKSGSSAVSLFRSSVGRTWYPTGDVFAFGFACYYNDRGPLFSMSTNGGKVEAYTDVESGLLTIDGEVGYVIPLKNRWYYFEGVVNRANRTLEVFINGKSDLVVPIDISFQTNDSATVFLNPYNMTIPGSTAIDYGTRKFDDFYMADDGRINPIQVTTRLPTFDVEQGWSVAGSSYASSAVGTLPPAPLDRYIYSGTVDAACYFKSSAPLPDDNPLVKLGLITLVRKATVEPLMVEVSIEDDTATLANLTREWVYRYVVMSSDGYTPDSIKTAKFGVKIKQ